MSWWTDWWQREAYVDDVVVKTKNLDMLIEDLKQTFENLNKWK
jgi:hypothetical protein